MNLLQILLNEIIFLPDGSTCEGHEISGYEGHITGKDKSGNLMIRDAGGNSISIHSLPFSGTSLHIHEGAGGTAQFKHDAGKGPNRYSQINSYDAAMADGGTDAYTAMSNLMQAMGYKPTALDKVIREVKEQMAKERGE